jgi:hypothetical protein
MLRFLLAALLLLGILSASGCTSKQIKKFLFPWSSATRSAPVA